MAYAVVQSGQTTPAQSGQVATVTIPSVTAGSLLVLGTRVSSENRAISSIVDDRGNTWLSNANARDVPNAGMSMHLFWCYAAAAGTTVLTITFDTSGATAEWFLWAEISGILSAAAFDVAANNYASGASVVVTTAATAEANELLVVLSYSDGASRPLSTPTATGLTFTIQQHNTGEQFALSTARTTAAAAQAVTQAVTGGNSTITGIVAAFKESASAPPATLRTLTLLGVG